MGQNVCIVGFRVPRVQRINDETSLMKDSNVSIAVW